MTRIAIASDHAAVELKTMLRDWLGERGHEVLDLGTATRSGLWSPAPLRPT